MAAKSPQGNSTTKTYVLDTSVLLADPQAVTRFEEHHVVIPLVVISELEKKRNDPELGYFARNALRLFDKLRTEHGSLSKTMDLNEAGGTLRIELNHISTDAIPLGIRGIDNDTRVLAVAKNLSDAGNLVVVVTKDLPMRVKASAIGLVAEEYQNELVKDSGWRGLEALHVTKKDIDDLHRDKFISLDAADELPKNTCLILKSSPTGSALGRVHADGQVHLVKPDINAFGVKGNSAEQRLALDLLLDPSIGIVSLGGRAGTGKSAMALLAGLEAVVEKRTHKKIVVFRPLYAVGGQELGYLPGSESDKMGPWGQAVFDTLGSMVSKNVIDEVLAQGQLEILPLTHIRGRSLHDSFVIVDEAQSLEKNVLLTVLSRIGTNSKVVLTHDVAQRDNLRVGRHDGIAAVVEILKDQALFGHVTLTKSERSPIAALVTDLMDDLAA